jgi:hypothetical protein
MLRKKGNYVATAALLVGFMSMAVMADPVLRLELADPSDLCFDNNDTFDVNVVADGFGPLQLISAQYRVEYDGTRLDLASVVLVAPLDFAADVTESSSGDTGIVDIAQVSFGDPPPGVDPPAHIATLTFTVVTADEYCGGVDRLASFAQYYFQGTTLFGTKLGLSDGTYVALDSGDFVPLPEIFLNNDTLPTFSNVPDNTPGQCIVEPGDIGDPDVDGCGLISVTRTESTPVGDGCTEDYEYTITWVATDPCGNEATLALTFRYRDTTGPTATAPPDQTGLQCPSEIPPAATSYAEFVAQGGNADDNCTDPADLLVEWISDVPPLGGLDPCAFSMTRTYRVTDPCSDEFVEVTQLFDGGDTTEPIIQNPDPATIECWAPDGAPPAPEPWWPYAQEKMHYPQLPYFRGWDVKATVQHPGFQDIILADDWRCMLSGPVDDIHFWGSWYLGHDDAALAAIHIRIHDDIPAGTDPGVDYSRPGNVLWDYTFLPENVGVTRLERYEPEALQGWYRPGDPDFENPNDHNFFYRYDITNIAALTVPFEQTAGEIYWLSIFVEIDYASTDPPADPGSHSWGWKTTNSPWNDQAVFWEIPGDYDPMMEPVWQPLQTPQTDIHPSHTDLAFVITGGDPPPVLGLAYAEDNCTGDPVFGTLPYLGGPFPPPAGQAGVSYEELIEVSDVTDFRNGVPSFEFQRIWTAVDGCDNVAVCTPQFITVVDTTPPFFTGIPEELIIECDASVNQDIENWLQSAVAEDDCCLAPVGVMPTHIDGVPVAIPPVVAADVIAALDGCCNTGMVQVTWTATDCHGNVMTLTRPITVQDTEPPVIGPVVVTDEVVDGTCTATVSFSATVSDACCLDPEAIGVSVNASNGTLAFDPGTDLTISGSGNTYTVSGTATVSDLTDCPAAVTVCVFAVDGCDNADSTAAIALSDGRWIEGYGAPGYPGGNSALHAASWDGTDLGLEWELDGVVRAAAPVPVADTVDVNGNGERVWKTLYSGGTAFLAASVWGSDVTADVVQHYNLTHHVYVGGSLDLSQSYTYTTTHAVLPGCEALIITSEASFVGAGGTLPTTGYPAAVTGYDVDFQWGTITSGKLHVPAVASGTGDVTDDEDPVITCPADVGPLDCNDPYDPSVTGTATATDNCPGVTVTHSDSIVSSSGTQTVTRTWTATDVCGNTDSCDQIITLQDNDLPYFTNCPSGTVYVNNEPGECYGMVDWTPPLAYDDCVGDFVQVTCDETPPVQVDVGDTLTVTCTADDGAGNTAQCVITFQVVDNQDPVLLGPCPDDMTVPPTSADCLEGVATWVEPDFSDNCGYTVNKSHEPGDSFPVGTTLVTYQAVDAAGNMSDPCEFYVTVLDSADFDMTVELTGGPFAVAPFNRCIEFKFYDCNKPPSSQLVATFRQQMTFVSQAGGGAISDGDPSTPGVIDPVMIDSLPCGNFTCVTARDPLHTLRSKVVLGDGFLLQDNGRWQADFVGAHALIGGNSDGIVGPLGGQIDIVDFTQLAFQWGQMIGKNTNCESPAPHTDFSGDGLVNTFDFSFIQSNFGAISDPVCCAPPVADSTFEIREVISVRELERLGLGYLSVVDVDADGWITMKDVQAYIDAQSEPGPDPSNTDPTWEASQDVLKR